MGEAAGNQLPDVEEQPDMYCSYSRSESGTAVTILSVWSVCETDRQTVDVCIMCICKCASLYPLIAHECFCATCNALCVCVCACEHVCT